MSNEYPKAIYNSQGTMAVVPTKDVEAAQWEEWGETAPDEEVTDLPPILGNRPSDEGAPLPGDIDEPLTQANHDDLLGQAEENPDESVDGANGVPAIEDPGKDPPEPEDLTPPKAS